MKLPPAVSLDLLDRYFSGDCTPDEVVQARAALAQSREVAALGRVVEGERVDTQALWERFQQSPWMREPESDRRVSRPVLVGQESAREGTHWRMLWPVLAAVVLVMGAIVGITTHIIGLSARTALPASVYATNNGQRANITLTDGTTVILNVGSRLEVPADYPNGNHALRLTGEGLFTVTHHDGQPFTVTTGQTTARVLGTSFVVRHYPDDTTTTVAVREGRVGVRSLVIAAAQQAVLNGTTVRVRLADASLFSFVTGTLVLEGIPLSSAIAELDRWYGADIRLGDSTLGRQRIRGSLPVGSLGDLVSLLELTFNVRVVRDGRVLTLYSR